MKPSSSKFAMDFLYVVIVTILAGFMVGSIGWGIYTNLYLRAFAASVIGIPILIYYLFKWGYELYHYLREKG